MLQFCIEGRRGQLWEMEGEGDQGGRKEKEEVRGHSIRMWRCEKGTDSLEN